MTEYERSTYSGAPDECSRHWPTKAKDCPGCAIEAGTSLSIKTIEVTGDDDDVTFFFAGSCEPFKAGAFGPPVIFRLNNIERSIRAFNRRVRRDAQKEISS